MIVLGIDPGTACTGDGGVRGDGLGLVSLVECGVIRTRARDPLAARLNEIYDGVAELLARHRPAWPAGLQTAAGKTPGR